MDLHKGKIRVFSKGEGNGSTFTVDLPMTRKIEPNVVHNRRGRSPSHDSLLGSLRRSLKQSPNPPSIYAEYPSQHDENLPTVNQTHPPVPVPPPARGSFVIDDPVISPRDDNQPTVNQPHGSRINLEGDVKSIKSMMGIGRDSLRALADHDMMIANQKRQTRNHNRQTKTPHPPLSHTHEAVSMSTDRYPSPNLQAGGGPVAPFDHLAISSPPGPLDDYVIGESAVFAVNPAEGSSNLGSAPPLQLLQPPAAVLTTMSHESVKINLPPSEESTPSAAAMKSRKQPQSQRQRSEESTPFGSIRKSTKIMKQENQGPLYHILVVDDSTMTRKMLMKTLCSRGEYPIVITHPLNLPKKPSQHSHTHTLP